MITRRQLLNSVPAAAATVAGFPMVAQSAMLTYNMRAPYQL